MTTEMPSLVRFALKNRCLCHESFIFLIDLVQNSFILRLLLVKVVQKGKACFEKRIKKFKSLSSYLLMCGSELFDSNSIKAFS